MNECKNEKQQIKVDAQNGEQAFSVFVGVIIITAQCHFMWLIHKTKLYFGDCTYFNFLTQNGNGMI